MLCSRQPSHPSIWSFGVLEGLHHCLLFAKVFISLQDAASKGASLVVLPEIWNSAYQTTEFPKNAEDVDGGLSKCADFMSRAAKQHGITLVGGSIPELSEGKTYNTCLVYDKAGKLLAKHRKVRGKQLISPTESFFLEFEKDTLFKKTLGLKDMQAGACG